MKKVIFNDNLTIKTLENGVLKEYSCDFYDKYTQTLEKMAKSQEWKYQGQGAIFRGDTFHVEKVNTKNSYYTSLENFESDGKVLFSVTVNDVSGVFVKDLNAEKDGESHVIHSNEGIFAGSSPSADKNRIITALKQDYVTSHLALFNVNTNDLSTLTDGDCYDFDPCYSKISPDKVLFATKGVGRDGDGDFVRYSPASICAYDTDFCSIEEVLSSPDKSYEKPKDDEDGNLYFIEKPAEESSGGCLQAIWDIICIPYRIIEAIVMFIEAFVTIFTGKGLTKASNRGDVKKQDKTKGEIFIEGNLINAEKEYQNNLKHKDNYAGYAPYSWQLIKRDKDGNQTVLAHSVIDYALLKDGSVVYTNGKHVLLLKDGKTEKLATATMCTQVAVVE